MDRDDPAFEDPTKFIGPVYDRATAGRMAADRGWHVKEEARKDRAAALLARGLDADALLLLTDVAAVERDYGTSFAEPIDRASAAQLLALGLPAGSMGPKVEAAAWFATSTGGRAAIGNLAEAAEVLAGRSGTTVVAEPLGHEVGGLDQVA